MAKPLRGERGDVRVIIWSYGRSANDKAAAARFNDWKGVDSRESKEQSIPDREVVWRMSQPRLKSESSKPRRKCFGQSGVKELTCGDPSVQSDGAF